MDGLAARHPVGDAAHRFPRFDTPARGATKCGGYPERVSGRFADADVCRCIAWPSVAFDRGGFPLRDLIKVRTEGNLMAVGHYSRAGYRRPCGSLPLSVPRLS